MEAEGTRIQVFGIRFNNLSFEDAVEGILDYAALRDGKPRMGVTPNVDHVVLLRDSPEMVAAYEDADLTLCDGMPLLWGARLLGRPLKARVTGSDLLPALCEGAAERGLTVCFLGGAPGVGEECARRMTERQPDLKVVGALSPPMGFMMDPDAVRETVEAVRALAPDLLFVALGSPAQEIFIHRHRHELGAAMALGVGAAIDFAAGACRRAPRWVCRSGFEWFWRLCGNPKRFFYRYLVRDLAFFPMLWREWRGRGRSG